MKGFRQLILLVSSEAIGRLAAFALAATVARSYGLLVLAYLTLSQSIIAYASVISDGGLNNRAVRSLTSGEPPSVVISVTAQIQLALATAGGVVVLAVTYWWRSELAPYVAVSMAIPIATALSTPYILRAQRKITPIAMSRIVGGLTTGGVGWLLVVTRVPGYWLAAAYSASAAAMALCINYAGSVKPSAFMQKVKTGAYRAVALSIRTLGVNGLLVTTFAAAPLLAAAIAGDETSLEQTAVAVRVIFIVAAPAAMLETVLLPILLSPDRPSVWRLAALAGAVGALLSVGLWLTAPDLTPLLFGDQAASAAGALQRFGLALPATYCASVLTVGLLASHGDRWLPLATGTAIAVFTGYVLANSGMSGEQLAWAWVSAQVSLCVLSTIFLRRISWRTA